MEHLFIPYEFALTAKEKGFNIECIGYYPNKVDGVILSKNTNTEGNYVICKNYPQKGISAPLYQEIVDWFRNEHEIHLEPVWDNFYVSHWYFVITKIGNLEFKIDLYNENILVMDYYEALKMAIEEAFKLI